MVDAEQTVTIVRTFGLIQVIALVTILVSAWVFALFMYKALNQILEAHRELTLTVVNLRAAQIGLSPVAAHRPHPIPENTDPGMPGVLEELG